MLITSPNRLNFMFTLAAVATNVCALLVGTILDQYGPRVSGIIGSALFALGCLGFSFSKQIHNFDRELSLFLAFYTFLPNTGAKRTRYPIFFLLSVVPSSSSPPSISRMLFRRTRA